MNIGIFCRPDNTLIALIRTWRLDGTAIPPSTASRRASCANARSVRADDSYAVAVILQAAAYPLFANHPASCLECQWHW